jgi:RNA-directed DNA polymerase
MLEALISDVKDSKWFSLIDKAYRSETLRLAWEAVRRNVGAAGVDEISVNKFEREGTSASPNWRRS